MPNPYYTHALFPTPNSPGSSAALRAELDSITAGFDLLPTLTANGYRVVMVNSAGTALVASAELQSLAITGSAFSGGTINNTPIGGATPTTGAFTTLTANGNVVATQAGSETLTNKTFNLANNTFVATSAQLAAAITDESGSGALLFANSPALTGAPTAPTAAGGTNTNQLATTAFVVATAFNSSLPGQTGNAGKFITTDGTNASWAEITPPPAGTQFTNYQTFGGL